MRGFMLNLIFIRLLGKPTTLIALIVIIIAISIRVIVVLPEVKVEGTGDDALRYDPIAQNLIEGNGFSKATQPPYVPDDFEQPGYPYFVAAIYWLTSGNVNAVVAVQLLLELATLFLVVRISRILGLSYRVQMFALAIGLACPFLPMFSGQILTEVLTTFVITLTCYLLIKTSTKQNLANLVYTGLACGCSILVRADLIISVIFMIMVAGFICWNHHRMQGVYGIMICTLLCLIVLTPWAVRNYMCFSKIRFLGRSSEQTNSGYAKWLSTWSVDYYDHEKYWWKVLKPCSQYGFPSNIFSNDEKQKAEHALRIAREQGTFDGQPSKEFATLACEARRKRPWKTYFVPVRRIFHAWNMMPIYIYHGNAVLTFFSRLYNNLILGTIDALDKVSGKDGYSYLQSPFLIYQKNP